MTAPNEPTGALPPSLDKVLRRFSGLGREEKMAALVSLAQKLPPAPERLVEGAGPAADVPECQTPLRLFAELVDGGMQFSAQINVRQSPTVAAFLALVFSAVNGQPPAVTLAIPTDFVRTVMQSLGLGTREVGLEAIVARLKQHARAAATGSLNR
ncbi:MAG: SufE family protein [Gemmatimonadaceae bacterium]